MVEKEYIEREALIRYAEKQEVIIKDGTSVADAMRIQGNVFRRCVETCPTADVAPKSEVEALGREVERLTNILNSYALQYGTVKDQHEVIDKAIKEFADRLKTYYRNLDKTVGALINYTIDQKLKEFLGEGGGKENG